MVVHDVKQGSPDWDKLRLGIPTASNFHRIITPKTMKVSAQAVTYLHWLLAEWIIGEPLESPETQWMQRGAALEDQAVRSYCFEQNCEVKRVGFITTDDGKAGCSPDRLICRQEMRSELIQCTRFGALEIKCPSPQVHVGNMLRKEIDDDHKAQVQGQMWIVELDWVDVESYCPGLPTVIVRAQRDEKFIKALSEAVSAFNDTMLEVRERLSKEYGPFVREEKPAANASAALRELSEKQEIFDNWRPVL